MANSFGAVTDQLLLAIAAAGHGRIIIRIRAERIMDWLQPEEKRVTELRAILDGRPDAYYQHRLEKAA
jgi:hypothetical protein